MTDLKLPVQVILQEAGYETWQISLDGKSVIGFEDETIMGFAVFFEDVSNMLSDWRDIESKLLTKHAQSLKNGGQKTWNVYSLFLCSDHLLDTDLGKVRQIEENLERTRKIAACGLNSQEDVITVMLPLLPLQYQPKLDSEDFDLTNRLKKQIAAIAPSAADAVLDNTVSPSEVLRLLETKS